jgi:hypothetical protein
MQISARLSVSEISTLLEQKISGLQQDVNVSEVGRVLSIGDGNIKKKSFFLFLKYYIISSSEKKEKN